MSMPTLRPPSARAWLFRPNRPSSDRYIKCIIEHHQTHLLRLGIIVGRVPLLGLLRGNLPGRLPERLGLGLRRHGDFPVW